MLISPWGQFAAVPVEWIAKPCASLLDVNPLWARSVTPAELHINPDTHWTIWKPNVFKYCAFLVNDPDVANLILGHPKGIYLAERQGLCFRTTLGEVDVNTYGFKGVLTNQFAKDESRNVLVSSPKPITDDLRTLVREYTR